MNYAIVILAAIIVAAGVYWLISGRKFYIGPLSETEIMEGTPGDSPKEDEYEKEGVVN